MNITICSRSLGIGVVFGALVLATAWYGVTLTGRAQITQALLAAARCDSGGFVTITFADSSQFTCMPRQDMPPTSREEADRRKRGGP